MNKTIVISICAFFIMIAIVVISDNWAKVHRNKPPTTPTEGKIYCIGKDKGVWAENIRTEGGVFYFTSSGREMGCAGTLEN